MKNGRDGWEAKGVRVGVGGGSMLPDATGVVYHY